MTTSDETVEATTDEQIVDAVNKFYEQNFTDIQQASDYIDANPSKGVAFKYTLTPNGDKTKLDVAVAPCDVDIANNRIHIYFEDVEPREAWQFFTASEAW